MYSDLYGKKDRKLKYDPKYAIGNDNYGFIKNEVSYLGSLKNPSEVKGFQFFFPNNCNNDFQLIRNYIEPREIDILKQEVYDMINGKFNMIKSQDDIFYCHGVNRKSDDIVADIVDSINRNFTYCTANFSLAEIYAFRFVYRFSNVDNCTKENISTIINLVATRFKNYIVIAQSNIMSKSIHFIISNHVFNEKIQNWYHDRFKDYRKYNGPDITFSRNPDKHMEYIQDRTNYLV